MRQRVVLNGRFLAQVHTGVQRYALETVRALDDILQRLAGSRDRLDFVLAVPDGAQVPPLQCIRWVRVPGKPTHLWEQVALLRFARGDYVVNFNYSAPLFKRRQLITVHDATVRAVPHGFSRSYRWFHNTMVALLGRSVHTVMTVSDFSRDELVRWFGLNRNDIIVGREGGEHAARVETDDAAVLHKHGLSARQFVLGVGSVKPNKNFGLIGRAVSQLGGYQWPVAIAGAKDIGIFRDASAVPDGFRFLGFVPDDELSALYRQAAWFVFPSVYEGFGLPAVEAMANGCPVLAARAASIPEVCGDAALYFEADDPASLAEVLRRVTDKPELREALVAAGRERLKLYNWHANARILLDHLQRTLLGAVTDSRTSPSAPSADVRLRSP